MSVGGSADPAMLNIMLNGKIMEVESPFYYLGSCFSSEGGVEGDVGMKVG